MVLRVYIGYDARETRAYDVAVASLLRHASQPVAVTPLRIDKLMAQGLIYRPTDKRAGIYDLTSNAPASTDFAISRFLVPHLAQSGFALFADADMVFIEDITRLFALADSRYAVQVVQHNHHPTDSVKMVNAPQQAYGRKNWSSIMLWNCDHPSNLRLTVSDVNHRRGLELHQFYWLHDSEIGELPARWNWLVDEEPRPVDVAIAHMTLGGPWLPGWGGGSFDEEWKREEARIGRQEVVRG